MKRREEREEEEEEKKKRKEEKQTQHKVNMKMLKEPRGLRLVKWS